MRGPVTDSIFNHTHNIGIVGPRLDAIPLYTTTNGMYSFSPPPAKVLTVLDQIKAEREEAVERRRVEAMYADYDSSELLSALDGTMITFMHDGHWVAGVKDDGTWSLTGACTPNGASGEDLLAWLILHDIEADAVAFVEVVGD